MNGHPVHIRERPITFSRVGYSVFLDDDAELPLATTGTGAVVGASASASSRLLVERVMSLDSLRVSRSV